MLKTLGDDEVLFECLSLGHTEKQPINDWTAAYINRMLHNVYFIELFYGVS